MKYLFILLLLVFPQVSFAAPTVTSADAVVENGTPVVIEGSGFGDGATILLYDDFERGTADANLSTTATIGTWSGTATNTPVVSTSEYYSGSRAAKLIDANAMRQFYLTFSDSTEMFVSYWARVPSASYFPGTTATDTLPSTSAWKMAWLMDGPEGYLGVSDMCTPTVVSAYTLAGGNDYTPSPNIRITTSNWKFAGWNRMAMWAKAGAVTSDAGNWWFQWLGNSPVAVASTLPVFDEAGAKWNRLNVPGWHRPDEGGVLTNAMYDDVYFAVGANSQARVEIGQGCVGHDYATCPSLSIATASAWSDTGITATVRQGALAAGAADLFVIDGAGGVSTGYSITIGSGDTTKPATTPNKAAGRYQTKQSVELSCTDNVGCTAVKYCLTPGCTPTTTYDAPVPVLKNIAYQVLRYSSTDAADNTETVKESIYRKQRRR